ncbi:hypothetical protein GGC03_13450 [Vibrio sp. THAF191c]|nr:hypothetical protein FIU99_13445 [Vibrio sp. THAF64]QGM35323.1 hypothetical protein GGC04_13450 [Vibrio sp. THAF191d]QGN70824.1 hypothetical protein GGC03_13450 [Vibrio sp. THAF191c]
MTESGESNLDSVFCCSSVYFFTTQSLVYSKSVISLDTLIQSLYNPPRS